VTPPYAAFITWASQNKREQKGRIYACGHDGDGQRLGSRDASLPVNSKAFRHRRLASFCSGTSTLTPSGKTILQLTDSDTSLWVDGFRAYGATMSGTTDAERGIDTRAPDLAGRSGGGPASGAETRQRLSAQVTLVDASQVETAWTDQRRFTDPMTYREATLLLRDLIPTRSSLLTTG